MKAKKNIYSAEDEDNGRKSEYLFANKISNVPCSLRSVLSEKKKEQKFNVFNCIVIELLTEITSHFLRQSVCVDVKTKQNAKCCVKFEWYTFIVNGPLVSLA